MTTKVRLLLLACTGAMGLVLAGGALAAFVPALAIGHQPPTLGSTGPTAIRLTVPRDDDALARAAIYVAPGYTLTVNQAVGTSLGTATAQILVQEPIAGAVLPLTGTLAVADPAALVRPTNTTSIGTTVARCTGTPTHAAIWLATLQASGQNLDVPIAVDPAPAALSTVASYVLTFCLPNPNVPLAQGGAPFGAKLVNAQLNFRGAFAAPSTRGTSRWHVVATPWPAGPGLPNVAGTVEAQGRVSLPAQITAVATSRRRVLTVRGALREGGTGLTQQTVRVRIGNRTLHRPHRCGRHVPRHPQVPEAGLRLRERDGGRPGTLGFVLHSVPVPGVSCVSETTQFYVATRTFIARVR